MNPFINLFKTPWFWSAFLGWTLAQCIKMTTDLVRTGRLDLFHEHRLNEARLKERLGHTRLEVFVGMLTGILVAMLVISRLAE